jgi:CII-binding regulator of phage lambda lysogenization HflD
MRSASERLLNVDPTLPTATTKLSPFTKQLRPPLDNPEPGFTALSQDLFTEATRTPTLATLLDSDFISRLILVESVYSTMWNDLESQIQAGLAKLESGSQRAASVQQSYQKYYKFLVATYEQLDSQPKLKATFNDKIMALKPVEEAAMAALSELNDLRQQLLPTLERLSLDIEKVEQGLYKEVDKAMRDLGETFSTLAESYQQLLAHLKERVQGASRTPFASPSTRRGSSWCSGSRPLWLST